MTSSGSGPLAATDSPVAPPGARQGSRRRVVSATVALVAAGMVALPATAGAATTVAAPTAVTRADPVVPVAASAAPAAGAFATGPSAGAFDRTARFTTERVRGGVRYSTITLTLGPTQDGNTRLLPVDGSAVPD